MRRRLPVRSMLLRAALLVTAAIPACLPSGATGGGGDTVAGTDDSSAVDPFPADAPFADVRPGDVPPGDAPPGDAPPPCPPPLLRCDDGCVDPRWDPGNCGACGRACPATASCRLSSCQAPACTHGLGFPGLPMVAPGDTASATDVALGDVTGDGFPDVVVLGDRIATYAGTGVGTFRHAWDLDPGFGPLRALALADLGADGRIDVLVAGGLLDQGTLQVLPGQADGSPGFPFAIEAGAWPVALRVADVDQDTRLDVLVLDAPPGGTRTLRVFRGAGDGTLAAGPTWEAPSFVDDSESSPACTLAVSDLDGDGFPDVMTGGDVASVGWNDGTGGFLAAQELGRGRRCVVSGRLDQDDLPDVLTGWKSMTAYRNLGQRAWSGAIDASADVYDGRMLADVEWLPGGYGEARTLLRLDWGHNSMDATGESGRAVVSRLSVLGGAMAQAGSWFVGAAPVRMAIGDVDGNGTTDVVALGRDGIAILASDALGGFPGPVLRDASSAKQLLAIDLNGDGWKDLVRVSRYGVTVLASRREGAWEGDWRDPFGEDDPGKPGVLRAADLDGDGVPDLAVSRQARFYLLRNRGDATFDAAVPVEAASTVTDFALADLDADGRAEPAVLVASGESQAVLQVLSRAPGGAPLDFGPATDVATLDLPDPAGSPSVTAADLDGDGRPDLVVQVPGGTRLAFRNLGGLQFAAIALDAATFASPCPVPVADLDADGASELIVQDGDGFGSVSAIRAPLGPSPVRLPLPSLGGCPDVVADVDGDGRPDVVAHDGTRLVVSLQSPDGTFTTIGAFPTRGGGALTPLDYDFDGRTDLVLAHNPTPWDDHTYNQLEVYPGRCH